MSDFFGNKTVDDYLNEVDFEHINNGGYVPSKFSLQFMNFIKMVNDGKGEEHKTPSMHLAMLDKVTNQQKRITNLCFRGSAKTTLFFEYMTLYLAMFNYLPGFGKLQSMLYISDSMDNGVKSARESIKSRYDSSEFLQHWMPPKGVRITENYMEFNVTNGNKFGVRMFGAKSGIRGTKIFGKRPSLAVLDDLISDEDAKSPTSMAKINDTVYKGLHHALHPQKSKTILNGTPFDKNDIVYQAIESGAWAVNVWPVCKEFPCKRAEFQPAWADRFTYDQLKEDYEFFKKQGKLDSFRQELMLRITDAEARLVKEEDIVWYDDKKRDDILNNAHQYNFYITTDFATSSKQTADYSVLFLWAYDARGNWHFVDGVMERQTMDKSIDDLFRMATSQEVQSAGIEVTGQQGGFIPWIQREMNLRDRYFNLAQQNGKPGLRPMTDKLSRFNLVVPLFKAGKVRFPSKLKDTQVLGLLMEQISLVTKDGIKGKDDGVDALSMLTVMNAWKPTPETIQQRESVEETDPIWGDEDTLEEYETTIAAYVT